MKAIILAAGVGRRLGDNAKNRPKCLLEFGGQSLLHRHLVELERLGVQQLLVVTGYKSADIETALSGTAAAIDTTTVFNPDFRSGSVISLYTARAVLNSGDEFLLMDADVLYHAHILSRLYHSPVQNCLLIDRDFEPGEEPVKICVHEGKIVEFRKQVKNGLVYDYQGESVGFFKFDGDTGSRLSALCQTYIDDGRVDAPYEDIIRELILQSPDSFGCEDISGLPWIEIDFPDDVEKAKTEILARI